MQAAAEDGAAKPRRRASLKIHRLSQKYIPDESIDEGGLVVQKGWTFVDSANEDGVEEAIVIKCGASSWQIGFAGEESPREKVEFEWHNALNPIEGTSIIESFLAMHGDGVVPRNVIFVISAHNYSGWEEWAHFAFCRIGFQGMLTCDSRHMILYSAGRRTGLVVDIVEEGVAVLGTKDGYV
jgi:hypothetical protein